MKEQLYSYIEDGHLQWKEPSFLIVLMFYLMHNKSMILSKIFTVLLTPPYYLLSVITGINIPRKTVIGAGLRIHHYGCIIINNKSIIGKNCTLRHEVTIGNRIGIDDCPIVGDNCDIGAGAKILGDIKIGDNVTIGANAVVITDIPDNSLAVGIPAKIIKKKCYSLDSLVD